MRASHKTRLARLVAAADQAEEEAVDRRCGLRFNAFVCADIRAAMEWRGIDPASSRVLLDAEAEFAEFLDSPELEAADDAFMAAHPVEWTEAQDPFDWLDEQLEPVALRYLDGSRPEFAFASLLQVWAWALIQPRLLPAIRYDRYGRSDRTS